MWWFYFFFHKKFALYLRHGNQFSYIQQRWACVIVCREEFKNNMLPAQFAASDVFCSSESYSCKSWLYTSRYNFLFLQEEGTCNAVCSKVAVETLQLLLYFVCFVEFFYLLKIKVEITQNNTLKSSMFSYFSLLLSV